MAKICNHETCTFPVFSHNYCRNHQHLRTDDKAQKVRTAITTSINTKSKAIKPKFRQPTGELELFKEVWNERPHVSELSGDKLYFFDINNFHHLLTKKTYEKFRLYKPNIILLTKAEHFQIHNVAQSILVSQDSRWQKVFDKYQQLKENYNYGREKELQQKTTITG